MLALAELQFKLALATDSHAGTLCCRDLEGWQSNVSAQLNFIVVMSDSICVLYCHGNAGGIGVPVYCTFRSRRVHCHWQCGWQVELVFHWQIFAQ
jgi:hypothetical protein